MSDIDDDSSLRRNRRGDGGTFLVVADETIEFELALRYAARRAVATRGHVAILRVVEIGDFQHWGHVEARMKRELRQEAEKTIWEAARKINDLTGERPSLYIREGETAEALLEIINEDRHIRQLVLASRTGTSGPGPLTTYFTGKGLGRLRVPVVIIPGHLTEAEIDKMS